MKPLNPESTTAYPSASELWELLLPQGNFKQAENILYI